MVRPGLRGLRLLALASSIAGCAPTVGTACDELRAHDVVYDSSGSPAYAGQSLFITTCASGGAFCHSDAAMHRYGAPAGMDFDLTLADSTRFPSEAAGAQHLYAMQLATHHLRDDIYGQVTSGAMPPGAIGRMVQLPSYVHADMAHTPVPDIRSADGREILRNWLACGSPVVEATIDPMPLPCTSDAACSVTHHCDTVDRVCVGVGAIEPVLGGTVAPHWSSIYPMIIAQSCTQVPCHSAAGAAGANMLDLSSATAAYNALVAQRSPIAGCGTRVVQGMPDASLLLQKLAGTQPMGCGARMPIGTPLPDAQIAVVRAWITAGALND